jgi:hypothetical protein
MAESTPRNGGITVIVTTSTDTRVAQSNEGSAYQPCDITLACHVHSSGL